MTSHSQSRIVVRGFTLVELMVVIAIIGLLTSVLATSVVGKMRQAGKDLDRKTLQDLYNHLQMAAIGGDDRARRIFHSEAMREARGREFWQGCFRYQILDADMLPRMISSAGHDYEANRRDLDAGEEFYLDPMSCSWAGPQGNEALFLMGARGKARRVVICVNERNWQNHGDEVLTVWSDGEVAEYVSPDTLKEWGYEFTREHWRSPAEHLFGKLRPFDGVFD